MMSYSRIIKANHVSVLNEVKVIVQPSIPIETPPATEETEEMVEVDHSLTKMEADRLIGEARAQAQEILEEARQKAYNLEATTEEKVNQWWQENREKLDELSMEANRKGYQEGFASGKEAGLIQIQNEYEGHIQQASTLLQQAYDEKEAIIAEAEPFLLELSIAIASQILKQELDQNPDKFVSLIKQHILRFKEKDSISVCVHPEDFPFIQEQRAHLLAMVNGETEIKIIPDHSVTPKGCIIRTAYGSVDARLDTQLEEIKKVILEVGKEPDHVSHG